MSKFNELVTKLREVFQIDRPELDFGVYRILNARADEINEYLEKRLKEKVEQALASGNAANIDQLKEELKKAEQGAQALGVPADSVPKVQELKAKIIQASSGNAEHENAVFSHLLTFFSRYYDNGDFISQRRYKGDTYAIPYAGEEVMLHWANKDQYYIKSGENFSNYSFKLEDGRVVHFRLVAADTAKDNRKDNDKERRFVLAEQKIITRMDDEGDGSLENTWEDEILPVEEITKTDANGNETKELIIRFEYKAMPKGSKQDKLVSDAVTSVLTDNSVASRWLDLTKREPTEKNPKRTLLEKHLTNYTTKNTADYFIHKNLGKFLRGELDFYIKNEVMHLDDVQNAEAFSDIEKNLRMIQCLRSIALDLIKFLAQLEDFQKKLWAKKKFVTDSNFIITVDKIDSDEVIKAISLNDKQWKEWAAFGFIEIIPEDRIGYLKANKSLIIDTALFDVNLKNEILRNISNIQQSINGLLINSENFQAMQLLSNAFREKIKVVVTDPPYNSGGNDFLYKDAYRNSSWLAMMNDRLEKARELMTNDGTLFVHIDDKDEENRVSHRLMNLVEDKFGPRNYLDNLIWGKNTTHNDAKTFSHNHEYILAFSQDRAKAASNQDMFRESKPGFSEVTELVRELNETFPPIQQVQDAVRELYRAQAVKYKNECIEQGLEWTDEVKKNNPWKGITQYKFADYRDELGNWVSEDEARKVGAEIWIWREDNPSWPNANSLTSAHKNPEHDEFRFYTPLHPVTGKPCGHPERGWLWRETVNPEKPDVMSFEALNSQHLIAYGQDENKKPQIKRFLRNVGTNVVKSLFNDFTDGEKELSHITGERGTFPNPKPTTIARRLIEISTEYGDTVLDLFAGSGTTGHAVLQQNFFDEKVRKVVLVEMGYHFYNTLLPRMKKCSFSTHWKDGKPEPKGHQSILFKYITLESYEDSLNNLELKKPRVDLFDNNPELKDDYLLNYMLDVESRGSLLSTDDFKKPFDYTMKIAVDSAGAFKEQKVDLVETFNYLIGLTVKHIDAQPERGFVTVTGTLPSGETCLVLWRDCEKIDYEGLNKLCDKLALNPADNEFDVVYINGDHNIPTVLTQTAEEGGETRVLKLRQIEPEFLERMFAEEDA